MDILKGKPKSSGLHYTDFGSENVCQRNLHLIGKAPWRYCSQLGALLLSSVQLGSAVYAIQNKQRKGRGGHNPFRDNFYKCIQEAKWVS